MEQSYNPNEIEPRWQRIWEETGIYRTVEDSDRPKYYCLDFFPYPSGDGLHVGHCRNYVPTDVISRYKRMKGFNVLHPMGWDAFGEPAEQFAVNHNIHPRITTDQNAENFHRQYRIIGTSYDWSREVDTSQPEYYRWTQWFFLKLYQRGLAYRDTNWQWWCPICQTTLSSHEAAGGSCWRGHAGVVRRKIPAWYFRITAYADELLTGLDEIDWPEPIKAMQRSWIGRSEGCEIIFKTEAGEPIPVFTTRPDTIFGVTFFAFAPEHPLVEKLVTADRLKEVRDYIQLAVRQSEVERSRESRPKTGVFTGGFVIHPLTQERIPVWVADYVLTTYGSGAVMGVPAHDGRDFEFARAYRIPIRKVVQANAEDGDKDNNVHTDPGRMINSGIYDGLDNTPAALSIATELQHRGLGGPKVAYRMRDWLISRQRYWGTPIPIVHCPHCGEVPVPEEQLPVRLPDMENFQPDGSGRSPLARAAEFAQTTCPACGELAEREYDTMGGFACSAWYYYRFASPRYADGPFDAQVMQKWLPVDLYVGGAEHAVLHLLYARFWTKVMADEGLVPFREPFVKLKNQGQLLAPDGQRMSKSRGNVITPDAMVEEYGADALRLYEMFMAPFDQDIQWSTDGIHGARRFLFKVWKLYQDFWFTGSSAQVNDAQLERALHQTIRLISEKIEEFRFNTMVSTLMEFVNLLTERGRHGKWKTIDYQKSLEALLVIMAPAAPHICEELWQMTGHEYSVHQQSWPTWDEELARSERCEIAVQVDGKLRGVVQVSDDIEKADVEQLAQNLPKVIQALAGRTVQKIIYVPGRMMSFVTSQNQPAEDSRL
jgi:leucyl-tRNA synthetase